MASRRSGAYWASALEGFNRAYESTSRNAQAQQSNLIQLMQQAERQNRYKEEKALEQTRYDETIKYRREQKELSQAQNNLNNEVELLSNLPTAAQSQHLNKLKRQYSRFPTIIQQIDSIIDTRQPLVNASVKYEKLKSDYESYDSNDPNTYYNRSELLKEIKAVEKSMAGTRFATTIQTETKDIEESLNNQRTLAGTIKEKKKGINQN